MPRAAPMAAANADGGRAANDHFADGFGDFAVIGVGVGDFFGGEKALVEHDHAAVGPLDGLRYVHLELPSSPRYTVEPYLGSRIPPTARPDAPATGTLEKIGWLRSE